MMMEVIIKRDGTVRNTVTVTSLESASEAQSAILEQFDIMDKEYQTDLRDNVEKTLRTYGFEDIESMGDAITELNDKVESMSSAFDEIYGISQEWC